MTYALGLPGFIAIKVLAPGFSARHDLGTPLRYAVYAFVANLLIGLGLVWLLSPLGWGHAALALATALAALLNALLLLQALFRKNIYRPQPGWLLYLVRLLLANLAMGYLLVYATKALPWQGWSFSERLAQLSLWTAGAGLGYLLCLWLIGLRPIHLRLPEGA